MSSNSDLGLYKKDYRHIIMQKPLTHRVAVNAFLLNHDRFLLLKRSRKPIIWGPSGGRLFPDEDPYHGLKREVREETGLEIRILNPVVTWFGEFNRSTLLSLDYLCLTDQDEVILSDEHTDHLWLSLDNLRTNQKKYFTHNLGLKLSDFYSAWRSYLLFKKRWEDLKHFESII